MNDISQEEAARELASVGVDVANHIGTNKLFCCPWCSPTRKRGSKEKCLSVTDDDKGVLYNCHHCGRSGGIITRPTVGLNGHRRPAQASSQVSDAKSEAAKARYKKARAEHDAKGPAPARKIVATYDYRAADGTLLYQKDRFEPKGFVQRAASGAKTLDGIGRVLYGLPELVNDPDATVFACEGEKDRDRVCTLGLCAVSGESGKWPEIVDPLRDRHVIIVADYDYKGVLRAEEAAAALFGIAASVRMIFLPGLDGTANNSDASDYLDQDPAHADTFATTCLDLAEAWAPGAEITGMATARTINVPQANGHDTTAPTVNPFKLLHINDLVFSDDPVWLIEDLIPAGPSLGLIFGRPKSGKTFVIADLFYHVAMGEPYCGYAVKQGACIYVTCEGVNGFHRRMIAMRQHRNPDGKSAAFYVINTMPNLGEKKGDAERLIEAIAASVPAGTSVAAVIVDTLRRATPGKNESSPEDMGIFIDNCGTIMRELKCFVGAVHHSPRSDDNRSSGTNSLDAAADIIISVIKDHTTNVSTITVEEIKDGISGTYWQFTIKNYEAVDRSQKSGFAGVTEAISKPTREGAAEAKAKPKLTAKQKRFFDILCETIVDCGVTVPGSTEIPIGVKAVTRDQLKKYLQNKGFFVGDKNDANRATANGFINDLAGKYVLGTNAVYVWLPRP